MYTRYIIPKRMTYLRECTDQSLMKVAFLLSNARGECSEPEMFNNQCDNQRKHLDEETLCARVGATVTVWRTCSTRLKKAEKTRDKNWQSQRS